jgi:uncharacterized repeat protein (TIGR03803 family)
LLGALLLGPWIAHVEPAKAQTFKTICSFPGTYPLSDPYYGSFDTNLTGAGPWCTLFLPQNVLYGTTSIGGTSGTGTIFSLSLQPQLTILPSGQNVVVTWPTSYVGIDYSGFVLESTTNLSGAWTTTLPAPVVVNAQYTVTNPIAGSEQFFRLSQ